MTNRRHFPDWIVYFLTFVCIAIVLFYTVHYGSPGKLSDNNLKAKNFDLLKKSQRTNLSIKNSSQYEWTIEMIKYFYIEDQKIKKHSDFQRTAIKSSQSRQLNFNHPCLLIGIQYHRNKEDGCLIKHSEIFSYDDIKNNVIEITRNY